MIWCITATKDSLDSDLDPRFGRCSYFIFVDPDTMQYEAYENPNIAAYGGAGIQSAQFVVEKGAELVITGNVGPNAYNTLSAAGVKVITGVDGKVRDVIERCKKGEFTPGDSASVSSHFGMGKRGRFSQSSGASFGAGMGAGARQGINSSEKMGDVGEEVKELKNLYHELRSQLDSILKRIDELSKKLS